MEIITKNFNELSLKELYSILQLRSEVFVVEQDCVYQDIDGKDDTALHVLGKDRDQLVAYTRCFKPGDYFEEAAIGRVIVKEGQRKYGYGHEIMKASIQAIETFYKTEKIKLSAQQYLTEFYESHGFEQTGEGYLEDGIPHIAMIKR
ncbi:GNAT family N-acetyltransferase [Antarcticibacterium flavum]|uniref:GNAT family N-acetyltransferase n=1 Tax=Antarcticibacterium flavum TaxID=2058175 RepID=A0A5B7X2W8_9FLAO|nr:MULTISPECIES: GNAT family N-acetyltransferase [Antarcticibacterium]MCM4160073.1 GNAT family N-acetyltransferase [Antarcticibacterium sp. W02-3]QCY69630.1 GNAT family N-acetyltransferase [Antarcticibacterium flavum]